MKIHRSVAMWVGCILFVAISCEEAQALPVFARKYGVSCQNCHTAFPNLTPFGKAFKKNGLRFPGEGSEYETEGQPLGTDKDKKNFPHSVYPSSLTKFPPFALMIESTFDSLPKSSATNEKVPFQGFGGTAGIFSAGTIGNHFSLWGGVEFESATDATTGVKTVDVGVERVYGVIRPFEKPTFLAKVGSFEPTLLAVSEHRSLLGGYFVLNDRTIGDNAFTPEASQQGVEFNGILGNGRFGYYAGIVEGNNNRLNNAKDFYGRVEYKIGGLRLDGVEDEHSKVFADRPWRDDGVTLGAFGYMGFADVLLVPATAGPYQKDQFEMFGADADINYSNFITDIGFVRQQNNHPIVATPAVSVGTNQLFTEINYVHYWFIPGVRYEWFSNSLSHDHRVTIGSTFVIRPNVKAYVRGIFENAASAGFMSKPEVLAGLKMGI